MGQWRLSEALKVVNPEDYYVDSLKDLEKIENLNEGDTRTLRGSDKTYIYAGGRWLLFSSDFTKEILINPSWDDVELERRRRVILRCLDGDKRLSNDVNGVIGKILSEHRNVKIYGRRFDSSEDYEAIYISLTENKGWKEIHTFLFDIKEEFTLDNYYESLVRRMF